MQIMKRVKDLNS